MLKTHVQKMSVTKMSVFSWMSGNMHRDKTKNEWTPKELEEAAIEDKMTTGCDGLGTCNGGQICAS